MCSNAAGATCLRFRTRRHFDIRLLLESFAIVNPQDFLFAVFKRAPAMECGEGSITAFDGFGLEQPMAIIMNDQNGLSSPIGAVVCALCVDNTAIRTHLLRWAK